jgi:hypothetical protein
MRRETSKQAISGRRSGAIALAAVAGAFALLTTAPARADGDFENAFEATLGHLVAFEAVNLGHYILTGGGYYGPPAVAYYAPAPVAYYAPPPVAYFAGPPVRYYRPGYAYGYAYAAPPVVKYKHVVNYENKHGDFRGAHHAPPRPYGYARNYDRGPRGGRGYHHDRGDRGRGYGPGW